MSKFPKRNYPITTDNVKNIGGKDMILKRMVNHYSALTQAKPKVDLNPPFEFDRDKFTQNKALHVREKNLKEFHNVRQTYKKVSTVKPYIDNSKPETLKVKPKGKYRSCKEQYDNMEHLRILEAMSKRILSIGKPHERRKNKDDPIANPTYFFRSPDAKDKDSDKATKLISLDALNLRLKEVNKKQKNKMLLSETIYKTLQKKGNSTNALNERAKSSLINRRPQTSKNKRIGYVDIEPEKYIQIHLQNRGDETFQRKYNTQKTNIELKENEMDMSTGVKRLMKKKLIFPLYDTDEDEFKEDITQFIIENRVVTDEEFNYITKEIIKKNHNVEGITPSKIEEIINNIKSTLDEE